MLSFADRRASGTMQPHEVKRIVFDLDGVLIKEKASWVMLRRAHGIPELYPLLKRGLQQSELRSFLDAEVRAAGLSREDFIKAANTVELNEHVQEIVGTLHLMGIGLDIATFAPIIYAKIIATRVHPQAFLNPAASIGCVPMNIYGSTVIFDSQGRYVTTFVHPNDQEEPWSPAVNIRKKVVLDNIAAKYRLDKENILFVSDGYDTEASLHYPTVGYRHDSGTLQTIAEITDLRELLRLIC